MDFLTEGIILNNLVSVKTFALNSGARNGCANFMGTWNFCFLSAEENLHAHEIPCFRGGVFWVLGAGECRFYFSGRGDFSELIIRRRRIKKLVSEFFALRARECLGSVT